jgi:hypothetical protein
MIHRKDSDEQKNAKNRFIFLQDAAAAATTPHDSPRTPPEQLKKIS